MFAESEELAYLGYDGFGEEDDLAVLARANEEKGGRSEIPKI